MNRLLFVLTLIAVTSADQDPELPPLSEQAIQAAEELVDRLAEEERQQRRLRSLLPSVPQAPGHWQWMTDNHKAMLGAVDQVASQADSPDSPPGR